MFDSIVIGSGFAGAVVARELAEKKGQQVLVIDARDHVGGNCYDKKDDYGILIHQYGPHIFHTNIDRVYEYLSRFTNWNNYLHEVVGNGFRFTGLLVCFYLSRYGDCSPYRSFKPHVPY